MVEEPQRAEGRSTLDIVIVGPTHPIKGGIAQHTTVLAHRLATGGHRVRLISWSAQYPNRLYPGVQTVARPEVTPFANTERLLAWNRPDSWVRVGRSIRHADLVVLVHVTPVHVPAYWSMLQAMRGGSAHVTVVCHNVLPHERMPGDRFAVARLLGAADRVITHTAQECERARSLTNSDVVVARLAPHAPDGFVRRAPLPGVHRRLLFFGIVRPYKGVDVLLRALAAGPGDISLRVAGEFWNGVGEMERLCKDLGIDDRVELVDGYVPAERVPELFADVDALVLPYRTATASQAVWLGHSFGIPVIATRAGHLADDIRDGIDGLVARPDDVASLAHALRRLYEPGVVEAMRANVEAAEPERAWEGYLDAVLATLDNARRNRRAGSRRRPRKSAVSHAIIDHASRRRKAAKMLAVIESRRAVEGLRLLDIGTGSGHIADALAQRVGAGGHVDSVDLHDERMVTDSYAFHRTTDERLPFPDGVFDVVVSNHVIEHVGDQHLHVAEIARVLASGGLAYLATPNRWWPIEPHYRLPFLSWLPRPAARWYVRTLRGAQWDIRPLSGRRLSALVGAHFEVENMVPALLSDPRRFRLDAPPPVLAALRLLRWLPRSVLSGVAGCAPSLVVILHKR